MTAVPNPVPAAGYGATRVRDGWGILDDSEYMIALGE
jgi:hypothetical protein